MQTESETEGKRHVTRHAAVRRWLLGASGLGLMPGLMPGLLREALAAESAAGMRRIDGEVRIGGQLAQAGQTVGPGQLVETGAGAHAVFVIGQDAFLQREHSRFMIEVSAGVPILRYLTGKVLSVFGPGRKQLETPTASIGIRGTGCYIEADALRTYFCLCYGSALLVPKGDPNRRKMLRARHHDHPVYIDRSAGARSVLPAHVVNHSDEELTMLEALVGRVPPFVGKGYTPKIY